MTFARLLVALLLLSICCEARGEDAPPLSRGAYLSRLGDCTSCHTAPGGKPFAGGLAIHSPFGTIYSSDITPDKTYGIGTYTLEEFSKALRKGVAKDGRHLYPAMPYTAFSGLSDEDIEALYTYFMQEVEPISVQPKQTKLPFPFNQRWGIRIWNFFFLKPARFKPDDARDANWNRGAYLAQTVGHCSACHSPRGVFFQEKGNPQFDVYLTGEVLDHWYAPTLRGDVASGLGSWSEEDVARFLKTGKTRGVHAFGNMAQVVENSTQHLTDEDARALAHYVKSLSATGESAAYIPSHAQTPNEAPGAGMYATYCASCHQPDGSGKPGFFPKLSGNPAILSPDATSLIRIVLEGGKGPLANGSASPKKMPGFASRLTDLEIAEIVTYIRQSWGNYASPVTPREVKQLRKALTKESASDK